MAGVQIKIATMLQANVTDVATSIPVFFNGNFNQSGTISVYATTFLDGNITNASTTIYVKNPNPNVASSTSSFPASGTLYIDAEAITYTGVTSTSFTGCTRGTGGTSATAHTSSSVVRGVSESMVYSAKSESGTVPTFTVTRASGVAHYKGDIVIGDVSVDVGDVSTIQEAVNSNLYEKKYPKSFSKFSTGKYTLYLPKLEGQRQFVITGVLVADGTWTALQKKDILHNMINKGPFVELTWHDAKYHGIIDTSNNTETMGIATSDRYNYSVTVKEGYLRLS